MTKFKFRAHFKRAVFQAFADPSRRVLRLCLRFARAVLQEGFRTPCDFFSRYGLDFEKAVCRLSALPCRWGLGKAFSLFFLMGLQQFAGAETALPQEGGGASPPVSVDLLSAVFSASIVVQLTLLILIIMSVLSWAVVFQKYIFFKEIEKENKALQNAFLEDGSFEEIEGIARLHKKSPLSAIFIEGWNEMQKLLPQKPADKNKSPRNGGLDNIERALRKATETELSAMETGLGFLATVGSSCPFIGLFGTVFGIMSAFKKIALTGGAGLDVVAPGIAEALLATGIGLFSAIPAVIFYNSFQAKIRSFELRLGNFSTDFLNVAGRNFFHNEEKKQTS